MKNKILFFFAILILSCGKDEIVVPKVSPNPPAGLEGHCSNGKVVLSFWANNNEYGFEGYNIYVIKKGKDPFVLYSTEGGLPTFRLYSSDINNKLSYTIENLNGETFTNGKEYNFYVKSRLNYSDGTKVESDNSDMITITFQTQDDITIHNYKATINLAGIDFSTNFSANTVNSTALLIKGWCDLYFELTGSVSAVPYLCVRSNSMGIQDMGYAADWQSYDYLPPSGYETSALAVLNHLYILRDTSDNFYVKIYLISVPSAQAELNDVTLTLKWSISR